MIHAARITVTILSAGAAQAQVQKVTPPPTVYWMTAATQSGFGMTAGSAPSAGDMMRMAMGGGGGGPMKMLELDLGSRLPVNGTPSAAHAIPPAMQMGASLPLLTPKRTVTGTPTGAQDFEPPKGRLLLFWGCGETARPGQPVVIDFAKAAAGQVPPGLFAGERVRIAQPPSPATWPTHGEWPNEDRRAPQSIPAAASMIGPHVVTGTYTPEIRFALQQDWMQGVALKQAPRPAGAVRLSWNAVPGATGHFAQMMGASDEERGGKNPTIVFWSSSDSQTFISALSDHVAPAEAARLVKAQLLLPPAQTSCSVPREAVAAAQNGLLTLVSHGPEINIIHPPRPADAKIPWVQEWALKARYVSRTGGIIGMDMNDMVATTNSSSQTAKPKCTPRPQGTAEAVAGAVLGGMFGRRKPGTQECEP